MLKYTTLLFQTWRMGGADTVYEKAKGFKEGGGEKSNQIIRGKGKGSFYNLANATA